MFDGILIGGLAGIAISFGVAFYMLRKRFLILEEAFNAAEVDRLQHQQDTSDAAALALQGVTEHGRESWRDDVL